MGNDNLHGTAGVSLSSLGGFIYRPSYGFSMDAGGVSSPDAYLLNLGACTSLGARAPSKGVSFFLISFLRYVSR